MHAILATVTNIDLDRNVGTQRKEVLDMIPFDFDYERPKTLQEAAALLKRSGPGARLLAGGTDLLPNMRVQNLKPALLISLGALVPESPQVGPDGSIRLDALSHLVDLINSDVILREIPMLAESAHAVGGSQIRQMGTLGGNLCQEARCLYLNQEHDYQYTAPCYKRGGGCCYPYPGNTSDTCWSVYMSDLAPALIALSADVEIYCEAGARRIPVDSLFTGNALKPLIISPDEIISAVIVPPASPGRGWGYHKSTIRGGLEFAMATIAVVLNLEDDGKTCADARIVVGAVSGGPLRASTAERSLVGRVLDTQRLSEAADSAGQELNLLPHHGFSRSYLNENIRVHLRRTLNIAFQRAIGTKNQRGE